jgi:hypothetical protein
MRNSIGEIIGCKGVYGTISDENRAINASGLVYSAPENWGTAQLEISSRYCVSILHGEVI